MSLKNGKTGHGIKEEVDAMFNELDTDRNGKISLDELKAKLEEMHGGSVSREAVEEFMKVHDADGDKTWSKTELAAFLKAHQ
ncbi:calmodulin [Clonorchis sinensis]|uniref:Calmodulin n=1 Tax=Clonorchis sinensis TaxID=79923 RepID=G7YA48_CLOSI|nr:calmodulin [Clonorchis sinensis]